MPYKDKQKQKEYQKDYRKDKPKSAISQYYQIYLFFESLTDEELQVLFLKRKQDCKYSDQEKIQQLRTEMAIINDILEKRQYTLKEEQ
jgi:hypothetical protein